MSKKSKKAKRKAKPRPKPKYFTDLGTACAYRNGEFRTPKDIPELFWAAELGGEAGELINIMKKLARKRMKMKGSRATVEQLKEEVADVRISLQHICNHYGINLDEEVVNKFNKTSENLRMRSRLEKPGNVMTIQLPSIIRKVDEPMASLKFFKPLTSLPGFGSSSGLFKKAKL